MDDEQKQSPQTDTFPLIFIAALFTDVNRWKLPKCPSTDGWVNTMRYPHTKEYHLASERSEVLPHAATWVNREHVMLIKISQLKKHKYDSTYEVPKRGKSIEVETIIEGTGGCGEGAGWGISVLWVQSFCLGMMKKKFWKRTVVMVVQHCEGA